MDCSNVRLIVFEGYFYEGVVIEENFHDSINLQFVWKIIDLW